MNLGDENIQRLCLIRTCTVLETDDTNRFSGFELIDDSEFSDTLAAFVKEAEGFSRSGKDSGNAPRINPASARIHEIFGLRQSSTAKPAAAALLTAFALKSRRNLASTVRRPERTDAQQRRPHRRNSADEGE
jgi:hypothetical protein